MGNDQVPIPVGEQEHASEDEIREFEEEIEDRQSHATEEEVPDVERDAGDG